MDKAIIIEDEQSAQQLLTNILTEYCPTVELLGISTSMADSILLINNAKPHILFLDIELEDCNAFDILEAIDYSQFKIIFTTAYDEYALKAFKFEAIDYLLKPYSPKDVISALAKVKKRDRDQETLERLISSFKSSTKKNITKISLSNADGLVMIDVNNIIRVEADRSYCYVYEKGQKKMMVSKPMIEIEKMLPPELFIRTHAGHIININHMRKFSYDDGGYVLLNDESQVPVSRRRRQDFLDFVKG